MNQHSELLPSLSLVQEIERAEIDYMTDRMLAIQQREGNPEGIKLQRFGHAVCYYSRTMPWPSFNTVKGITSAELEYIEPILEFYRERGRKPQLEIIPEQANERLIRHLSELGLYPAGHHCSLIAEPRHILNPAEQVRLEEVKEGQMELYATIHCRGAGLSDDGIPYVTRNNEVLLHRPGWNFYIAYVDDRPAAAAVMYIKDSKASLTFAATLPEFRQHGLHRLLLIRRITEAYATNCGLVVGQCAYLSQSHRNMEHVGMKLGYVRASWTYHDSTI
ncbi:GNAT family N-acetyltransferase [Paenibacillus massiliensis]|uniref:GNAT family N-acetyltransferase n=1 Tax=Paenibacillus massiliensis TaxID=225917 RepID=UPI0004720210|nr:GNAT family N-acetyltransferase [Paenibacillus massiliensis]